MHDTQIIIRHAIVVYSWRRVSLEVEFGAALDIGIVNRNELVAVGSRLLVLEADGVAQFVHDDAFLYWYKGLWQIKLYKYVVLENEIKCVHAKKTRKWCQQSPFLREKKGWIALLLYKDGFRGFDLRAFIFFFCWRERAFTQ